MQSSFGTVLWVVCGFGIVAAFVSLIGSGKAWDEYGKSALLMESDLPTRALARAAMSAASTAERDDEIRQMLEARNTRRARRGEPAIDIDAELARLVAPAIDDALRAEIRELVIARNFRRVRHGQSLLDVDAEVARQVAELGSRHASAGGVERQIAPPGWDAAL
jgi:hypothetical protein